MLCAYCHHVHGLKMRPSQLFRTISPFGPSVYPTGCCIQPSVAMMKKPESHAPMQVIRVANQCSFGPSRFSPNSTSPRNVDSRKNENTPSMARVCPMTPPAAREKAAQLVPN